MGYIIIQNKGELPLWGMRLLGLSNKSEQQIGRFGTGLKESIAMLVRKGIPPIIFSGETKIEFSIQEMDGQQEICFRLSQPKGQFQEDKWHGLGMHPNFGHHDWNDAWMMFREIICNAVDESGIENLYHDVTNTELDGRAGSTRIYIPVTNEILSAYSTVHERLLFLTKPEVAVSTSSCTIYHKRNRASIQIYTKGVWVQESAEESLFDYEIHGLRLNESRSADWYNINNKTAESLPQFTTEMAEDLLRHCIEKGKQCYELDQMYQAATCHYRIVQSPSPSNPFAVVPFRNTPPSSSSNWKKAFQNIFGTNAVLTNNDANYYDKLTSAGKTPVIVTHKALYDFLNNMGVPTSDNSLSKIERDFDSVEEPSRSSQEKFDAIWETFKNRGITGNKIKPPLKIFTRGSASELKAVNIDGQCLIPRQLVGSQKELEQMVRGLGIFLSGDSLFMTDSFYIPTLTKFVCEKGEILLD